MKNLLRSLLGLLIVLILVTAPFVAVGFGVWMAFHWERGLTIAYAVFLFVLLWRYDIPGLWKDFAAFRREWRELGERHAKEQAVNAVDEAKKEVLGDES